MYFGLPKRYKVIRHTDGNSEIVFSNKINTMRVVRNLFGESGATYYKKGREYIVVYGIPKQIFLVERDETNKKIMIPPVRGIPQEGWIIGWWFNIHREHIWWIRTFKKDLKRYHTER